MTELVVPVGRIRAPLMDYDIFGVVVFLAAAVGSLFLPGIWYDGLIKPWWTPPDWVFPAAWTPLYLAIAVAGAWAWRETGAGFARIAWVVQLILNVSWTVVMFGAHEIAAALVVICILLITILASMLLTSSNGARLLFVPYLAWVSFSATLNYEIWRLNIGT